MELLSVDNDPKTTKGRKYGVLTAPQYLAPEKQSGIANLCPFASAGCAGACLFTAGHGIFADVRQARINRTILFMQDRSTYWTKLIFEIARFERKAHKLGMTPAVRLNATSDIKWESTPVTIDGITPDPRLGKVVLLGGGAAIMSLFPSVQFYDYTAWPYDKRPTESLPSNYDLTFSRKENNDAEVLHNLHNGRRVAVVFNTRKGEPAPTSYTAIDGSVWPVVNGDDSDVRFQDPVGVVVALYAKGKARKDTSGFVVDASKVARVEYGAVKATHEDRMAILEAPMD